MKVKARDVVGSAIGPVRRFKGDIATGATGVEWNIGIAGFDDLAATNTRADEIHIDIIVKRVETDMHLTSNGRAGEINLDRESSIP